MCRCGTRFSGAPSHNDDAMFKYCSSGTRRILSNKMGNFFFFSGTVNGGWHHGKKMSKWFVTQCIQYLQIATNAVPSTLQTKSDNLLGDFLFLTKKEIPRRRSCISYMVQHGFILERLRNPVTKMESPRDLFPIYDPDVVALCIASGEDALSVEELRSIYFNILQRTKGEDVIWLINEIQTGANCCLLHLHRSKNEIASRLRRLTNIMGQMLPPRTKSCIFMQPREE